MRTVDPEKWSKAVIKPKSIFGSFSYKRKPRGLESLLRDSFGDSMREFWMNSSISGNRFFKVVDGNKLPRKINIAAIVALLACAVTVTVVSWKSVLEKPMLTTSLKFSQRSLTTIDFPAVAFCSHNLISRTKLMEYSTYLNTKDGNQTYSLEEIEQNLLHFGALAVMRQKKVDVRFTRFLAEVGGDSNVTDIMLKLSPSCMAMLERCLWLGAVMPCDQLFAVRLLSQGFCCAFNSRHQLEDSKTPAKKVVFGGPDSGLGVVIRENSDDSAYVRRPTDGMEVLIWEGSQYPVVDGGPVKKLPIYRNSSVFISLREQEQYADRSINYSTENWRECRLPIPEHEVISLRSFSWCLLECREVALRSLCSCTPHTLRALYMLHGLKPRSICSLEHLTCLSKHREIFQYFTSLHDSTVDLEEEHENALTCPHCLPDCTTTWYYAKLHHVPHQHVNKRLSNVLAKEMDLTNASIVHVYFSNYDQTEYQIETALKWYEIIVRLSSYWACIVGAMILILFELVFHCTLRWRRNYTRRRNILVAHQRLWTRLNACPPQSKHLALDEHSKLELEAKSWIQCSNLVIE